MERLTEHQEREGGREDYRRHVLFQIGRRTLLANVFLLEALLAAVSLVVILHFRRQSLAELFAADGTPAGQVLAGALIGAASAILVSAVTLKLAAFAPLRRFFTDVLAHLRPTNLDFVLISIAAGVGEELFFRALLQPLLGLWPASVLFALAHVSMPPTLRAKLAFACFTLAAGLGLGLLYERAGLTAVITTHAVYDLLVLLAMNSFLRSRRA